MAKNGRLHISEAAVRATSILQVHKSERKKKTLDLSSLLVQRAELRIRQETVTNQKRKLAEYLRQHQLRVQQMQSGMAGTEVR